MKAVAVPVAVVADRARPSSISKMVAAEVEPTDEAEIAPPSGPACCRRACGGRGCCATGRGLGYSSTTGGPGRWGRRRGRRAARRCVTGSRGRAGWSRPCGRPCGRGGGGATGTSQRRARRQKRQPSRQPSAATRRARAQPGWAGKRRRWRSSARRPEWRRSSRWHRAESGCQRRPLARWRSDRSPESGNGPEVAFPVQANRVHTVHYTPLSLV